MPKVFISHAVADAALVDDLRAMLQGAIGLQPGVELFSSSGAGTGVPAGKNFVEYIRQEMDGATFVIAVITPSFLQSTFCLAELGAVWMAAEDKSFFPVAMPPVNPGKLSATLTGIHVVSLDERPPLAQLLKRISDHFGRDFNAEAADDRISTFQTALRTHLQKPAPAPVLVPKAQLEAAQAKITDLGEQVTAARSEASQERRRADEILAARTLAEAKQRADAIPEDIAEAIDQLIVKARKAVGELPSVAVDVLLYELRDEYMPPANFESDDVEDLYRQIKDGLLLEHAEGLYLNESLPEVSAAIAAAKSLRSHLDALRPDQKTWFLDEFHVPADLRTNRTFSKLLSKRR